MNGSAELSEADYLSLEAQRAKDALALSLKNVKAALTHSVDPVSAARRHPILAISSAAFLSFMATVVAVPSKEERELRQLERLHRAMHPQPQPVAVAPASSGNGSHPASKPPVWALILKEVIGFVKPILLAQITSKVQAEAMAAQPADYRAVDDSPPNR